MGGATGYHLYGIHLHLISIHAPRGGSDLDLVENVLENHDFNPRSPWGERHSVKYIGDIDWGISIHAPRGGSDTFHRSGIQYSPYFNPRSPWGERLVTEHPSLSVH